MNTQLDQERKFLDTLRAVAALAGVRVDPIETDDGHRAWIVTRWALTKQANTPEELESFLAQMGIHA